MNRLLVLTASVFAASGFVGANENSFEAKQATVNGAFQKPADTERAETPIPEGFKDNANQTSKTEEAKKDEDEPKHIQDNSFLIEEAYNQEAGVVQHIFNWVPQWSHHNGRRRDFLFNYLIELPVGSQTHQFSFFPMTFESFSDRPEGDIPEEQGGWGDTLFNYRYQLFMEDECGWRPAVAPRISLIVPTGDEERGFGTGELGYQFNLPISKQLDPFAFHFNAGFTYTPDVSVNLGGGLESPGRDVRGYNLGASAIWLATYDLNFFVELVAFWEEELDENGIHGESTTVLVNPGFRYAVYTDDSVQWVAGVGVPIGLSEDAPDYGVFFYVSVEHAFKKKPDDSNGGAD